MDKMWAGRFQAALDRRADDFNSSISFDSRMYRQDIRGSMAHAAMLGAKGIIGAGEAEKIIAALETILADLDSGALRIDMASEDIHMFVEAELTRRIGDTGKRLHTARSRNDQVAVDLRMYLRDEAASVVDGLRALISAVLEQAEGRDPAGIYPSAAGTAHHLRTPSYGLCHDVPAGYHPHPRCRAAHEYVPPRLLRAGGHHL